MKAIKFIGALLAALALSFTFTACGDDDVDDVSFGDLYEQILTGELKPSVDIKKSSNELQLTAKFDKYFTLQQTAKFSNDVCTSCTAKYTFANEAMAKEAWADYDNEDREYAKLSGKTITEDWTDEYEGEDYDEVLEEMEWMKRALESGRYFDK